ncbi:MAG: DUF1566 domain-containing protein [Sulfurimonas sp.]|nr:DUF1566 domain-containing protein [Sulfurimonas sp.]MBU3939103.1 DUF1566 domain-containing protein [bacterium]MBU4024503.1 DUF1566 domain-containing protein [bacterium]MBU4058722.1 DUF1566 domain-containing protein [bacterium]MBU4111107.1 DUF1566 domain-containing protein [bacterium]
MIKISLAAALSATIASAWFMPSISFGGAGDDSNTHVDKNFVRDDAIKLVQDTKNAKLYYDAKPSDKMHFFEAWEYCKNMDYQGFDDWRVITKEEAVSLLELSRRQVNVKHAFKNVQEDLYWTSTEDRYEEAWVVDFDLGRYSTKKQTNKYRVICVTEAK